MSWYQDEAGLWSLVCDSCGSGWYDEWDSLVIRFEDPRVGMAFAQLCGWDLTEERMLCSGCFLAQMCGRLGHRWGDWTQLDPSPLSREPEQGPDPVTRRVRFCEICTSGEYDPPHLPRHLPGGE